MYLKEETYIELSHAEFSMSLGIYNRKCDSEGARYLV